MKKSKVGNFIFVYILLEFGSLVGEWNCFMMGGKGRAHTAASYGVSYGLSLFFKKESLQKFSLFRYFLYIYIDMISNNSIFVF